MTFALPPLSLSALTATSAMGRGLGATRAALLERRSGLHPVPAGMIPEMPGLWVGAVPGLEDVVLPGALQRFDCRNNRLAELALQGDGFADAVSAARSRYGAGRIAVVLGTSTSGIEATEQAYRRRDAENRLPADFDYAGSHDLYALPRYVRARLGLTGGPALAISPPVPREQGPFWKVR